jgi:hypothetical protein
VPDSAREFTVFALFFGIRRIASLPFGIKNAHRLRIGG